jgi:hypothetical protein
VIGKYRIAAATDVFGVAYAESTVELSLKWIHPCSVAVIDNITMELV